MTFSILARDPVTGAIGGAAATGSLCVGGWVLRGSLDAGMSASQGASPSTLWGEEVLDRMARGEDAETAVATVTNADPGRGYRQLSALDLAGRSAAFTGTENLPAHGSEVFADGVVAGNLLGDGPVLTSMVAAFSTEDVPFDTRLINALRAAEGAGGDSRGLLSAALLVLHPDSAPLTLRIDFHDSDPIGALQDLHRRATTGDYAFWARQVPTRANPERVLD